MKSNRLKIKDITPKESFELIEKKLLRLSLLKFKDCPNSIINLKEISIEKVILLILNLNISFPTITAGTKRTQCIAGRNRSQGDLFRIVKYYKDVSLKEFREALFNLINDRKITILYCPDVNKLVVKAFTEIDSGPFGTILLSSSRIPPNWISDLSAEQITIGNDNIWYSRTFSIESFKLKDELGLISQISKS